MYVKYIGGESSYFTKNKIYIADWEFDEMACIDDTDKIHILKENEYDTLWFDENFIECDSEGRPLDNDKENEPISKDRSPHYIGKGEYQVVYKKSESSLSSDIFFGICENFNPLGLSAFWSEEDEMMLLVDYKNILGLYPI